MGSTRIGTQMISMRYLLACVAIVMVDGCAPERSAAGPGMIDAAVDAPDGVLASALVEGSRVGLARAA